MISPIGNQQKLKNQKKKDINLNTMQNQPSLENNTTILIEILELAVTNTPANDNFNEEIKTYEVIPVQEGTFIDNIKDEEKEIYNEQFN